MQSTPQAKMKQKPNSSQQWRIRSTHQKDVDRMWIHRSIKSNIFCHSFTLFSCPFCQYLLHGLLFFQQKGTHDTWFDTSGTAWSSVGTRDSALSLLHSVVFGRLNMLDPLKSILTVAALGSLCGLVGTLGLEFATRGSNRSSSVWSTVVGVASNTCPAAIRHDEWIWMILVLKIENEWGLVVVYFKYRFEINEDRQAG